MTKCVPAEPNPLDTAVSDSLAPAAAAILRGVQRLLRSHDFESIAEAGLSNGRRADAIAIGPNGDVWIVEIKSSIADFRSDNKWPEYRDYCDRLFFAVAPDFPSGILPADTGLMLADRYGGEIIRDAPETRLSAARRKVVTLAFARVAAARLASAIEPPIPGQPT